MLEEHLLILIFWNFSIYFSHAHFLYYFAVKARLLNTLIILYFYESELILLFEELIFIFISSKLFILFWRLSTLRTPLAGAWWRTSSSPSPSCRSTSRTWSCIRPAHRYGVITIHLQGVWIMVPVAGAKYTLYSLRFNHFLNFLSECTHKKRVFF